MNYKARISGFGGREMTKKIYNKTYNLEKVLNAKVNGKVQGVFFRKYTYDFAMSVELVGIVKNLEDGTVFITVSGTDENLKKFKKYLQNGSPDSRVDKIDYSWEDSSVEYSIFEIEY